MNFEIEKLKQMLIATREKNGGQQTREGGARHQQREPDPKDTVPHATLGRRPHALAYPGACIPARPAGVYVPAQQYEEECEERRVLGARVEELEAEAEAVAAQHELAKQDWQLEMAAQAAAHEQQMGQVRRRPSVRARRIRPTSRAAWPGRRRLVSILYCIMRAWQKSPAECTMQLMPCSRQLPACCPARACPQVRSQLAATQDELRQARLAIQERDHAIATHQRCEAALAGHAGALHEALAGAVADVALLFQRWDEKNVLEDANATLVQVGIGAWACQGPGPGGASQQAGRVSVARFAGCRCSQSQQADLA